MSVFFISELFLNDRVFYSFKAKDSSFLCGFLFNKSQEGSWKDTSYVILKAYKKPSVVLFYRSDWPANDYFITE